MDKVKNLFLKGENKKINTIEEIENAIEKERKENDDQPVFILLVGSPGVGKTTTAKKIIEKKLHMDYTTFYHASLDFVVEQIKPYRNATKKAYNRLKQFRESQSPNSMENALSNKDYALLSDFYSIVRTKGNNFGVNKTANGVSKKINELMGMTDSSSTKKKATKKNANSKNPALFEAMQEWLMYGIYHRYNIIYDTTLNGTKKRLFDDVLPLLEEEHKLHPDKKKYKIHVILVDAPVEEIKSRLRSRHKKMTNKGYIRALRISMTDQWAIDNLKGFKESEEFYSPYPPVSTNEINLSKLRLNNNEKTNHGSSSRNEPAPSAISFPPAYTKGDFTFHYQFNPTK